jgi:hypothetical protein
MPSAIRPLSRYRLFQRFATGIGVLVLLIGAGLFASDRPQAGNVLLWIGGTLLVHGLLALAILHFEERQTKSA